MSGTRQTIQYSLALEPGGRGDPPVSGHQGAEPFVAKPAPESSAGTEQLMEEVCNRENLVRAWKRVRQNKGGPGVDGMTIDDAKDYLGEHWPSIRSQLLAGTYQPKSSSSFGSRPNGRRRIFRQAGMWRRPIRCPQSAMMPEPASAPST